MKTTRREFLKLAGCAAIAAAAGRATPGMQVEEPQVSDPAEWAALDEFDRSTSKICPLDSAQALDYVVYDDFSRSGGALATPGPGTRVVVDPGAVDIRSQNLVVHPSVLEVAYGEPTIRFTYEQFDKIVATFQPQRTDDLKPGVADWIGYRGIMWALWIIEEGPYTGQWAFGPALEEMEKADYVPVPWGWMPEDDLVNVERYDVHANDGSR